ncbi:MAG: hypothetical protein J6Y86_01420 [Pseudobutyrivibrio sp.]|nr:hypothetical protein [Pseudobutyrivibrio sp.]
MNPFFNLMRPNPMMQVIQQYIQIKQNPQQLANLLRQRGMITENQFADVSKMGSNYQQIGQYLMQNGKMPTNIQSYEDQISQVQNMANQNLSE